MNLMKILTTAKSMQHEHRQHVNACSQRQALQEGKPSTRSQGYQSQAHTEAFLVVIKSLFRT